MDPGLNSLLKWGVENSDVSGNTQAVTNPARSELNEEALRALMGGPSDADLMKQAMQIISGSDSDRDAKLTAFDNFEQLIEGIDNANNMEPLGLWSPLIAQLDSADAEIRRMAAWCIGTAVQNNVKAQERLLAMNGIPKLCAIAMDDTTSATKKKGIYALSSAVRNYQPSMNEAVKLLPKTLVGVDKVDAGDMDTIDNIMTKLRNSA